MRASCVHHACIMHASMGCIVVGWGSKQRHMLPRRQCASEDAARSKCLLVPPSALLPWPAGSAARGEAMQLLLLASTSTDMPLQRHVSDSSRRMSTRPAGWQPGAPHKRHVRVNGHA